MNWLGRGDVALLALMLVNAVVIICHRFYHYSTARRQSRAFVHDAAAALRDGRFDEVITIAARHRRSHEATVVAAGLNAFASAPPQFSDVEAIDVAERAFQRRRRMLTADLELGLNTLASIASSAPFIGLFGTVFGILGAFREVGIQKDAAMAMITSSLAEALVTTVMGLLVAVPAVWWHNYLHARMAQSARVFGDGSSNFGLQHAICFWRTLLGSSIRQSARVIAGDVACRDALYSVHLRPRAVRVVSGAVILSIVGVTLLLATACCRLAGF
jgi:biopolymer transport protein ExbB/biopolymer transport protein TolQ